MYLYKKTIILLLIPAVASRFLSNRIQRSTHIMNIRLTGSGSSGNQGMVEIQGPNGTWGTVCDDAFDANDAHVVCRMLGFNSSNVTAYQNAYFGQGSGPIWLDDLSCNGSETDLDQCRSAGWGTHNCQHSEDAGVYCSFDNYGIRLVGSQSKEEGRVEIVGPNGTWGTVCDDEFDANDAIVICRMLGLSMLNAQAYQSARYGQGSGPIYLDDLRCTGFESNLRLCNSSGWGRHNCGHGEDASVSCHSVITNIRLTGPGSSSNRGLVEIQGPNGTWGTICDDNFDANDAHVICRMLGFNNSNVTAYQSAYFGQGSGPIWLDDLSCNGSETYLDQCGSAGWGTHNCQHSEDAGVYCSFDNFAIRLAGSRSKAEGRVEIIGPDGTWGTVCDDDFDANDAMVICRMLGFSTINAQAYQSARYGQGSGPIYLDDLRCTGFESSLRLCNSSGWGIHNCGHGEDASVSCYSGNKGNITLAGGESKYEGRVEILHNGEWGTICGYGFDYSDADVICFMLGYESSSIQYNTNAGYGAGTGRIWLEYLQCRGYESSVEECPSLTWGSHSCSHNQDVGVNCHQTLRLIGGRYPSEGNVQIGNSWETLCSYQFDSYEAQVVCRNLRYNASFWSPSYYTSSYFKLGSDQVSNISINCELGTESDLVECKRIRSANCGQGSPAAVNCTGSLSGRLVGGAHNMEGRLLISNKDTGQLHRVCTDVWNDKEATMYCRLIFPNAKGQFTGKAIRSSSFAQQAGSFVFLSRQCNGRSPFCVFEVNSTNVCHYTDIAMSCTLSESDGQHSIRLVNGRAEHEGRVEINLNSTWYTLCDNSWDVNDATVLCRSLGYWVSSPTVYTNAWFGQGSVLSTNPYLYCNGLEPSIFDCQKSYEWGTNPCSHSDDAGVQCQPGSLGRDKVRLAYGPGPWKGKLEVFYNNQWGGFCMHNWNQLNTAVVCRMLLYKLSSPAAYVFNGTSTTVLFGDLKCVGNETDIGLCKAFTDISNCTNDVVGIDCSGGIQVQLSGGNSSMGYVQIHERGRWKQICSSGWYSDEAKVFCRSLGFSVAAPSTNANLSNSISASGYLSIDCAGWENHVDQCSIQNVSSNCSFASVNCLNCYYEYTANTGTLMSTNYPSSYPSNWGCLYIIKPHGPSRSGFYILKFTQMILYNDGDEVEVREGFPGSRLYSWKGSIYSYGNTDQIVAKEFSVHFHSDSYGENQGFSAQWAPLALDNALTAGCTSSGWSMKINTTIIRMLDHTADPANIYMSHRSCTGKVVNDELQFLYAYTDCGTNRQMSSDEIIYTNHIIQPIIDPNLPNMIFEHLWRVETRCSMPVTVNNGIGIYPTEVPEGSIIDNSYHNLSTSTLAQLLFTFYTDPAFHYEIKGNLFVPFGHDLYVKVVYDSRDTNIKMRLDTCTIQDQSSPNQMFTLIRDGCPTHSMVHIISMANHEARFSYRVFEFQDSNHWLTLNCNATFCIYYDSSHRCTPGCTAKRELVPEQESLSTVTHEVKSARMILRMETPDAVLSANVKKGDFTSSDHYLLGGHTQVQETSNLKGKKKH